VTYLDRLTQAREPPEIVPPSRNNMGRVSHEPQEDSTDLRMKLEGVVVFC
jgi:hypothetical protein